MATETPPLNPTATTLAAADKAHQALDGAAAKAQATLDGAKPALQQTADAGHAAIDQAAAKGVYVLSWMQDKENALVDLAYDTADSARQYVLAHPLKSLAIAAASGYVLGRLALGSRR